MTETSQAPEPEVAGQVADAVDKNWVDTYAPAATRPYLRLSRADRPIGTWLLLLPCWWGVLLAAASDPAGLRLFDLWIIIGCAIGAFLMRGAGCTWNDITDREFDAQVARTKSRPIPSGQVTVAHTGSLSLAPVILYLAGIAWTLFYDTIYAHQDTEDDALIGVKSTARLFGDNSAWWLRLFLMASVALLALAIIVAMVPDANVMALVLALAGAWAFGWHMVWQLRKLDTRDWENCLRLFRSNRDAGLIATLFLAVAALL